MKKLFKICTILLISSLLVFGFVGGDSKPINDNPNYGTVLTVVDHPPKHTNKKSESTILEVNDPPVCIGDGTDGKRVRAVYMVASDRPNNYATVKPQIEGWASQVDGVFTTSAQKTDPAAIAKVRWYSPGCVFEVYQLVCPTSQCDNSFNATKSQINNTFGQNLNHKYLVWVDASVGICGISNLAVDNSPGPGNLNNGNSSGVRVSRVDPQCWGRTDHLTEAHELAHNLGAVQPSAPHGTSGGHCTDEFDTMCYNDGTLTGGQSITYTCDTGVPPAFPPEEMELDCNNDDYYAAVPAVGSWLSTHWNVFNSDFIETSVVPPTTTTTTTTTLPPPPTYILTLNGFKSIATYPWQATITVNAISNGSPLADVTINGDWQQVPGVNFPHGEGPDSCVTNAAGTCDIVSPTIPKAALCVTFIVSLATHSTAIWDQPGSETTETVCR